MRVSKRWASVAAVATIAVLAGGTVGIAQDKMAQVTSRQEFMKAQGADLKKVVDFSKGEGDQQAAITALNDLLARAPKINDMFPPGTSATDFPGKSNAKPEIWTDWEKVKLISTAVAAEEQKLLDAVKTGDKAKVTEQLPNLGKNGCGACHGTYRVKTT